jgi:hypothetical protein
MSVSPARLIFALPSRQISRHGTTIAGDDLLTADQMPGRSSPQLPDLCLEEGLEFLPINSDGTTDAARRDESACDHRITGLNVEAEIVGAIRDGNESPPIITRGTHDGSPCAMRQSRRREGGDFFPRVIF